MSKSQAAKTRPCPICGTPVPEDFLYTHVRTDLDVLNELTRQNPSWIQPDGSCPRGIEELRASRAAGRRAATA